jgi:hypothetical protein
LNGGDLGDDPFGGGWNSWNIGVKSWEVKRAIVQPAGDKIPLYICGEAYSDAQGWVEGALQTTERMLAKLRYPLAVRRRLTGDIRRGGDASAIARGVSTARFRRSRRRAAPAPKMRGRNVRARSETLSSFLRQAVDRLTELVSRRQEALAVLEEHGAIELGCGFNDRLEVLPF